MDEQSTELNQDSQNVSENNSANMPPDNYSPEPQTTGPIQNLDNKKPKSKKMIYIILGIIIASIVMASAVGAYIFINSKNDNNAAKKESTNSTDNNKAVDALKPVDVVGIVQKAVENKFSQVVSPDTKLTGDQIAFRTSDAAPYWMVKGVKFYVNYTGDGASNLGVYFVDSSSRTNNEVLAQATAISTAIGASLVNQGFIKSTTSAYSKQYSALTAYAKDDVVCAAESIDGGSMSSPIRLYCGQISKYTKNLASYIESKPFADAYAASGKTIADGSLFTGVKISDSVVIGYKRAEVGLSDIGGVGGAMGLFYEKGNEGWRFFTATQQTIDCSSFNTVDLVNSFKGTSCYDSTKTGSATESFVQ
jgi:flagellar basal body-associated protein FliL